MKPRTIITTKATEKVDAIVKIGKALGIKLSADSNAQVSAQGDVITDNASILETMKKEEVDLIAALKQKVQDIKDQKKITVTEINTGGKIVAIIYALSYSIWLGFGFILSKIIGKGHLPDQPVECSAIQGKTKGTCQLNRKTDAGSWCRVIETNGDPANRAGYFPSSTQLMKTSKLILTPKNLRVPTWFILIPVNGTGDGVESEPFGGTFV